MTAADPTNEQHSERIRHRIALCEDSIHPAAVWYRQDTAVLATSHEELRSLAAAMAAALRTAVCWDDLNYCNRCVDCDSASDEHEENCEIDALLARWEATRA